MTTTVAALIVYYLLIKRMRSCAVLNIADLSTDLIGPVSLCIRPGECLAVLGASGSGKSLLLRAIADLDPSEGEVRLNASTREQIPANEWRRLVSLVPAESGWWADRVVDHFAPGPDRAGLLEAVGLPEALNWEVSRLSSGEKHRLAIARALQGKPKVLLLDEPTASLDPDATQKVEGLLSRQCANGVAVLLVTHELKQAKRLASQIMSMRDGRLAPLQETAA